MRQWLNSNGAKLGTVLTISNPVLAEIVKLAGFDWIWIDGEHGNFDCAEAAMYCAINAGGPKTLVRLPDQSATQIKRFLDIGADGIILPQVSSLEEVRAIGVHALYPPRGRRSVGISRAQGFGSTLAEGLQEQNYLIFVQIESRAGVENIDEIVRSEVVDGVLLGPYDLSGSYGMPGEIQAAVVQQGLRKVLASCKAASKPCGIFAATKESGRAYIEAGFDLVAIGIDSVLFLAALKQIPDGLREWRSSDGGGTDGTGA